MKYLLVIGLTILVSACDRGPSGRQAVFLLVDTSGTYTEELGKAQKIVNYLLGTLESGDSLAVARIDSGSFSEKDLIHKMTFDLRPSVANNQKRMFKQAMDNFVGTLKNGSSHTDISGAVLQATEYLNETQAKNKTVMIFSDLEEDLPKGHIRDFKLDLDGIDVVALNVTKLRSDNLDPRDYLNRLEHWQSRILEGNGGWRVINDFDHLSDLL
jgi:hypothetical protein